MTAGSPSNSQARPDESVTPDHCEWQPVSSSSACISDRL